MPKEIPAPKSPSRTSEGGTGLDHVPAGHIVIGTGEEEMRAISSETFINDIIGGDLQRLRALIEELRREALEVAAEAAPDEESPFGVVLAGYEGTTVEAEVQGNLIASSFRWLIYIGEDPPSNPFYNDPAAEAQGEVDARYGVFVETGLTALTGSEKYWVAVIFFTGSQWLGDRSEPVIVEAREGPIASRNPWWEITIEDDGATFANFGVRLHDPFELTDRVEWRYVQIGEFDSGWTLQDSDPNDLDQYNQLVQQAVGRLQQIMFRFRWRPAGTSSANDEWVTIESMIFGSQVTQEAVSIVPRLNSQGQLVAIVNGTAGIESVKVAAALTNPPSDSTVRAQTPINANPAESGILLTLEPGQVGALKAFGYTQINGGGTETPKPATAKIFFGVSRQPRVHAAATRADDDVTISIEVEDLSFSVSSIQYRVRQSDDASWGSWSNFSTSTGTIGVDEYLSRGVTLSSPDGKDTQVEWRVEYSNEVGDTKSIGDVIFLANLREIVKTLKFPFSSMVPVNNSTTWSIVSYLRPGDTTARSFFGSVVLPVGIELQEINSRAYRNGTSDDIDIFFYRISNTAGSTTLATLTHNTTGWQTIISSLSETVAGDIYVVEVRMDALSNAVDTKYLWTEFDYLAPGYSQTY